MTPVEFQVMELESGKESQNLSVHKINGTSSIEIRILLVMKA